VDQNDRSEANNANGGKGTHFSGPFDHAADPMVTRRKLCCRKVTGAIQALLGSAQTTSKYDHG